MSAALVTGKRAAARSRTKKNWTLDSTEVEGTLFSQPAELIWAAPVDRMIDRDLARE